MLEKLGNIQSDLPKGENSCNSNTTDLNSFRENPFLTLKSSVTSTQACLPKQTEIQN